MLRWRLLTLLTPLLLCTLSELAAEHGGRQQAPGNRKDETHDSSRVEPNEFSRQC